MRFLPGNHDIGDNPLETGPSSDKPLDHERLAHYRRVFGPDWWTLELGAWQIVGLNAQLFATGTHDEEAQFAWLDEALRHAAGPLGVLLHKPLFAMQERIGEKRVGALTLELTDSGHRIDETTPDGLVRHNLADYPDVYPELAAIKVRLGARAAL